MFDYIMKSTVCWTYKSIDADYSKSFERIWKYIILIVNAYIIVFKELEYLKEKVEYVRLIVPRYCLNLVSFIYENFENNTEIMLY